MNDASNSPEQSLLLSGEEILAAFNRALAELVNDPVHCAALEKHRQEHPDSHVAIDRGPFERVNTVVAIDPLYLLCLELAEERRRRAADPD